MTWVTKNLLSQATPCFTRHVKPLVRAAFTVLSTYQSALGLRGGLWPVLLMCNLKACAPTVGALIGWWWWWWLIKPCVRSTARYAVHLRFHISSNTPWNKSGTKSKVYSLMYCWLYLPTPMCINDWWIYILFFQLQTNDLTKSSKSIL
jgi:hypothetical protein